MPNTSPYSPSTQNPSYGSGGFNGTGHGSFSPVTGANQPVPSANYTAVTGGSVVIAAANPYASFGIASQAASTKPPGEIGFTNGDILLVFNCVENGQEFRAEFAPEYDFSALDSTRIVLIVQLLSMGAGLTGEKIMSFIRKYSLERHFKFTAA